MQFTVTNTLDSGTGLLGAAIEAANAGAGAESVCVDTMQVPAASAIALTSGQLAIAADPTIAGDRDDDRRPDSTIDAGGTTLTNVPSETTAATIRTHLDATIERAALLVIDGDPFFPPCARASGLTHRPLDHEPGRRRPGDRLRRLFLAQN